MDIEQQNQQSSNQQSNNLQIQFSTQGLYNELNNQNSINNENSQTQIKNNICEEYNQTKQCSKGDFCQKIHLPFFCDEFVDYQSDINQIKNQSTQNYAELLNEFMRREQPEFQVFDIRYNEKKQVTTIIFTMEKFIDKYTFSQIFKINQKQKIIESQAILCHENGEYLLVDEHHIRLLMARYFIRLNCTFRYGCFTIHPMSGELSLKMNSYLGDGLFEEVTKNKENFFQYLRTCNFTAHYALQFHTPKILHMINLVPESIFYLLDPTGGKSKKIRFPHEDCKKKLDQMKDILVNQCTRPYPFSNNQEETEYFRFPKQNASNGLTCNIYSKLNIIEFKKNDTSFNGGGFAEVFRAKITYAAENKIYTRTVAVKQEKNDEVDSRIKHEKRILSLIERFDCPYIAKFYQGQWADEKDVPMQQRAQYQKDKPQLISQDLDNLLFMEFYPNKSFDHFKSNFQYTMSLNTKVYLLFQVAQGIRFLKDPAQKREQTNSLSSDYSIYHLDLKPANILISKNYIAKITDFGESFNQKVCDQKFKPGRTLPYAAPEILGSSNQHNQKYTQKADVFSFGVLISDIIFDEYPVEVKRGNQMVLQQKYQQGSYKIKQSEDYKKYSGPKHLIKILFKLILKCMEDKEQRPYIEYVVKILRDSLTYIEKMY